MMFLVRSTFWLGIVISNMPLDQSDKIGAVDLARNTLAANAADFVLTKCAQDRPACRAALEAAAIGRAQDIHADPRGEPAPAKSRRRSADSLNPSDLAAPWRGAGGKSSLAPPRGGG